MRFVDAGVAMPVFLKEQLKSEGPRVEYLTAQENPVQ